MFMVELGRGAVVVMHWILHIRMLLILVKLHLVVILHVLILHVTVLHLLTILNLLPVLHLLLILHLWIILHMTRTLTLTVLLMLAILCCCCCCCDGVLLCRVGRCVDTSEERVILRNVSGARGKLSVVEKKRTADCKRWKSIDSC